MLASLAEAYGNSSVWSQHVTNGIMNMLYSITEAEVHSAGSGHCLGFPCAMYPEAPKAKKSCSSWGVGECHRQKLKHFVKRPSGPPTQKQTWPMEFSYWQLLFFHIQVCKNEAGNFRPWNLQQVLVPRVTSAEGEGVHLFFGARSFLRSMTNHLSPLLSFYPMKRTCLCSDLWLLWHAQHVNSRTRVYVGSTRKQNSKIPLTLTVWTCLNRILAHHNVSWWSHGKIRQWFQSVDATYI